MIIFTIAFHTGRENDQQNKQIATQKCIMKNTQTNKRYTL